MMRLKSHHCHKRRLLFCNHKHDYNNKDNNHRVILFVVVILVTLSLISLILFSPSGIPKSYAHAFTVKSDSSSPSELLPKLPSKVDVYHSEPVKLSQLNFSIQEFKTPYNNSQLLYPVYDKNRNVIWVGDTIIDSGRILEYDLNTDKYTEHKVNGTSIVTIMTLDPNNNNQLWYVDPLMKNLGQYNIVNGATRLYKIPSQGGVISGIAADSNNNIWLTSPSTNEILRFDTKAKNFTTTIPLPTANAQPFGITVDRFGQIWIAESGIGKLANIDPTKGYRISEYAPTNENDTLASPTAVLADPNTGNIYISQHDGHAVSVFNPILKTFNQYPQLDPNGLPFGMAFDGYGNLWVAEHTINKIAVIDLRTNTSKEINIPTQSPFVQWLTSDSKGNVWLAEQQGNSLGVIITATAKKLPQTTITTTTTTASSATGSQPINNGNLSRVHRLGFSYADIVGPSSLAG